LGLGGLAYRFARELTERLAPGRPQDALVFAVCFTAADTLRSHIPFGGFPWGRTGFSQAVGPLANWAWVGGVPLVGLATVAAGALLTAAVGAALALAGERRVAQAAAAAAGAATLVALPVLFPLDTSAQSGTLKVGAVQGDVEVAATGLFARQREVLENHVDQTYALIEDPAVRRMGPLDVILWPENSTDIDPREDPQAAAAIDAAAEAADAPILVGAMDYLPQDRRYNQGVLWVAGKGVVDVYSKQHPAPFAEYMPARDFFRLFTSKVDLVGDEMLPGQEVGVIDLDARSLGRTVALGDVICFEVAYDSVVGDAVRAGAEVVVVQTNNATFKNSEEATQQFAMTRLRAIEFGRATVQISTVGVSAAVAPDGSLITPLTGLMEPAHFAAELPLRTGLTPAARVGPAVGPVIMLAALLAWVAGVGAVLVARRAEPRPARSPARKRRAGRNAGAANNVRRGRVPRGGS
jgi:apolipoprotein N-acyltransferase